MYCGGSVAAMMAPPFALGRNMPRSSGRVMPGFPWGHTASCKIFASLCLSAFRGPRRAGPRWKRLKNKLSPQYAQKVTGCGFAIRPR
jgi:hypothetical protein